MARKTTDVAAAKQRRLRVVALVGGLLLAVLLAIQVPRTMSMLDGGGAANPAPASANAPAQSSQAGSDEPAPATSAGAKSPAPSAELADSDPVPSPDEGDLDSLERFTAKDPFIQQMSDAPAPVSTATSASTSPSTSTSSSSAAPAPADTSGSTATGGMTLEGSVRTTAGTGGAQRSSAVGSAVVSVNGSDETVAVSQPFPRAEPTFRLVSLTARSAKIGIASGSYTSGARTVTLTKGKRVTLMNTNDGKRYELRLVSVA